MSVPEDETAKYASLLATGERVLLVRQRHWLTFLEAGRWFVLALVIGLVSGALDAGVPNSGVASTARRRRSSPGAASASSKARSCCASSVSYRLPRPALTAGMPRCASAR